MAAEGRGILNWLIEGAARWQAKGFGQSAAVAGATEEYRSEMDALGTFLTERCVQSPGVTVKARELYNAYREWRENNNERAYSERFLAMRHKDLGLERCRTAEARMWRGIMLKARVEVD